MIFSFYSKSLKPEVYEAIKGKRKKPAEFNSLLNVILN